MTDSQYDGSYLSFDFSWTGSGDNPKPVCLLCGIEMASKSMLPSKLGQHFRSKHYHLLDKPASYFKRRYEQHTKTANSFKIR